MRRVMDELSKSNVPYKTAVNYKTGRISVERGAGFPDITAIYVPKDDSADAIKMVSRLMRSS